MTTSASALPALPPNTDMRKIVERLNVLVRWFNRPDLFVPSYAPDSGSGTAYVTTPSADVKVMEIGQEYSFKATNANTVTNPTLNVQGIGAGTITKNGGSALAIGDIPANSFPKVIVSSTTPTFELTSPAATITGITNTGATTFLTGDVTLVTINTFVNGPNTGSIGAAGQTWLIIGGGVASIGGGGGQFTMRIHDGTSDIRSMGTSVPNNVFACIDLAVVVTLSAATTFTLQACDNVGGSVSTWKATATNGATNKATCITAVRLA